MKKILTLFKCTLLLLPILSFTQTISFETSEGYTLGSLRGQQNWILESSTIANVVNTDATHGTNSVNFISNNLEDWTYIERNIPHYSKVRLSADIKMSSLNLSDHEIYIQYFHDTNEEDDMSIGIGFGYENVIYTFGSDFEEIGSWVPNRWYNFKVEYDFRNYTYSIYLDNNLVSSGTFDDFINSFPKLFISQDNYGSNMLIDNIKIEDISNLGLTNENLNTFSISPNPTTDFIDVNTSENIKFIEIYDTSGKILSNIKDSKQVDVQNLPKGIYILKVTTDKGLKTQKFIKN